MHSQSMENRVIDALLTRQPALFSHRPVLIPIANMARVGKQTQNLQALEQHVPKSLHDVRLILAKEIATLYKELDQVERAYYGPMKTIENELKKYLGPIKVILLNMELNKLSSCASIERILTLCSEKKKYEGDLGNVLLLKEVYMKVQNYLPDKFKDIHKHILKLQAAYDKYCVSFYDGEVDCDLETASCYEQQIKNRRETIQENFDRIKKIAKKFKLKSFEISMFSTAVASFCRRHSSECAPFLLLFAESCLCVRGALEELTRWLEEDENYAGFIKHDIADLEKAKKEKTKCLRASRQRYHSITYNLEHSQMQCGKLMYEVENMKGKEEELTIERNFLLAQSNDIQLDIEIKEAHLEDLKKRAVEMNTTSFADTIELLTHELRFLKEKLPLVKRHQGTSKHKLTFIFGKNAALKNLTKEIEKIKKDLIETGEVKRKYEIEYNSVMKTILLARKIYLYKTSNDSVSKIYYQLPVEPRTRKLPGNCSLDDPLDRVCRVVSKNIERSWTVLYRNLPFVPLRGEECIQLDIEEMLRAAPREEYQFVATKCLNRWRRYHTRAKPDDVIATLKAIKRFDVARLVHEELYPTQNKETDEADLEPPPVEPYLIPFYRQVERFDQLRAANKI